MKKLLQHKYSWIFAMIVLLIIVFLSSQIHGKLDLTKEKRFSLSPATKELVSNLDNDIAVEVYLTGNLSSGFKKLKIAVKEILDNYRNLSNGKMYYRFMKLGDNMNNDSSKAILFDSLARIGIKPFNSQYSDMEGGTQTERWIFPYAIVKYQHNVIPIDLMSGKSGMDEASTLNNAEALLEYKLDDAIDKLTKTEYPIVAYATGNGEPVIDFEKKQFDPRVADLLMLMQKNYRFGTINISHGMPDANAIKALLIVKPSKPFSETDKLKIDQYIMHGGKVFWCIDKLYAEFDSLLRSKNDFVAFDKNLNLDDILFKYGVRINNDLVQDLNCAKQPLVVGNSGGQPQIQRIPYPYYPLLSSPNNEHPISKNLDFVWSVFPSSIDLVEATNIQKTVLLATDTLSRTIASPTIVTLEPIKAESELRSFNRSHIPVSVLLEGKFTSLYANRITPGIKDSVEKLIDTNFLPAASTAAQQIVCSDGDIITNALSPSQGPLPMGTQPFENYQFANRDFFLNCLQYMVGNASILSTRNKEYTLRLLDKNKVAEEKNFWQIINIVIPILLIIVIGLTAGFLKKKKYSY